ncbi:unnamed protein product [marine sediment metagenome]|uniref:Uncharacterized protein n=1 Tax=marine sediment metagenome TaxID=412755 RepID=X1BIB9_9ZZZZ
MIITLTPAQWESLASLVTQGRMAQVALGLPTEIVNSDQRIEIADDEVVIELTD